MPAASRRTFAAASPYFLRSLRRLRAVVLPSVALPLLLSLTGCQTYTERTQARDEALRTGNIAAAVAQADQDAEKNADNKDTILFRLEQGAILRSAALANLPAPPAQPAAQATSQSLIDNKSGAQTQTNQALNAAAPEDIAPRIAWLTRSLSAFEEAARRIEAEEAAAKVKLGSEVGAALTNQANTPYRGRAYDKVMLHTYQALNYLQLRDPEAARVELNRALQSQRDAVEANARRIAEAQKLTEEAKSGGVKDDQGRQGSDYDVDRAKSDPRTSAGISGIEGKFNAAILPYGDYVNPFTTFLDALVFTHQGLDASDLERARKSWERVVSFAPQNSYARADYVAVEPDQAMTPSPAPEPAPAPVASTEAASVPAASESSATASSAPASVPADASVAPAPQVSGLSPQPSAGITYVIFETGAAPYRDQIRIDLPLFVVTSGISYVGMALPQLETVSGHASVLTATTTDGRSHTASLVASMDSVVAQDFKNEWPAILTKTIISTATKATIDAILQKQIQDQAGATGALLFQLATAVTQAAINIADTRTWRSLPKEFHYARIDTPADRQLTLAAGSAVQTVTLEPAAVQVVYVKSPSAFSPLLVGQFVLKK